MSHPKYNKRGSIPAYEIKVLLPEKSEKWRKNKPKGGAKDTFNDAVPFNQRKKKVKYRGKKKRR